MKAQTVKKVLAVTLALTTAMGMLTGCGSKAKESDNAAPAQNEAGDTDTSVPAADQTAAPAADSKEGGTLTMITSWEFPQEVLDKFKAETGIEVKQDVFATDYETARDARMASGEALDIIGMDQAAARDFSQKGYLTDLTDEAFWSNIKENAVNDITNFFGNDKRFGVCYECSALGVWYNKDIFAKYNIQPPTNFEEFISVCDTLVENGVKPLVQGGKDVWPLDQFLRLGTNQLTQTYPTFQKDLEEGKLKWNDPDVVKVLEERLAILQKPEYYGSSLLSTTYDQCWQIMLQQEAAMWVMGNWGVEVMVKSDAEPTFEVGAFAAPNNAKTEDQVMVGDTFTRIFGILETSENKDNAKKFLEFMAQPENAEIHMGKTLGISTVKEAASPDLPASEDWAKITQLPISNTYTFHDKVNEIMDPMLTNIAIGDMTVQEYCDKMQEAQEEDNAAMAE